MRNPKRIDSFMKRLTEVWKKVPDWRFGQLMCNVLGAAGCDPFFVEDEEMISVIEKEIENFTVPGTMVNNHIEDKLRNMEEKE